MIYVLITPKSLIVNPEEETLDDIRMWENDDEIYRGHILNAMSVGLFDVYHTIATIKEFWGQLQAKYMRENARNKKFLVSSFNNYKMVDNKLVME